MTTTMRYIIHRRTLTRDHDSCELVMGFSFHVLFLLSLGTEQDDDDFDDDDEEDEEQDSELASNDSDALVIHERYEKKLRNIFGT